MKTGITEFYFKFQLDFAKSKNIGGAMVWSLETDDFHGNCGKGVFPIIHHIRNNI